MRKEKAKRLNNSFRAISRFWNSCRALLGRYIVARGFTLIELLVALAILGILSSVLVVQLDPLGQINKAKDIQRQQDLTEIKTALNIYYNDHNCYSSYLTDLEEGAYIKKVPRDPSTGSEYVYTVEGVCPQWYVLFAKMARPPPQGGSSTTCPLTSYESCLPQNFNDAWVCGVSGNINCSYLASSALPDTGIVPTRAPTLPIPRVTPTPTPATFVRVFVTSATYTGNLGGLAGADIECQERADAAKRGGTWKAWLSTGPTTFGLSAGARLAHATTPYKLLNGTTIADNWNDLVTRKSDGSYLRNKINVDEQGNTISVSRVWTDTNADGESTSGSQCSSWQSGTNATAGDYGDTDFTSNLWTNRGVGICSLTARLYCFEQ